ncbi:MAB_1171c family putative transporter [Amycolatopsis cihanbeyliensis]|uniref:DUF6545 domain-containing protein n=1 Tax=Amycolatopsis cihanbeyliensis TaxID=1128664 RepID=A0A542DLF6_AMYCI|nr:MAB_1171c family putative transporter [Amycolatopsis cihanbeyliensis]TQJ03919.1 hypothetical protein FB471_3693 [Amycolatopsis cihanbeyliensis]
MLATLSILVWAAAGIAAGWKLSQLVRAPRDRGLLVVTACTVLVFIALSAQLAANVPALSGLFPSQSPKLIQNVVLTFFFALLITLLHSVVSPATTGSRGAVEVPLALLATAGLIAAFAAGGPDARGAAYGEVEGRPGALAFYLVGNLYMSYATARGSHLSWVAAEHTRSRARLSLRVAAAGLAVNCLGVHLPRVLSTSGRLAFDLDLPPGTATWTPPVMAIGIVAFFLGIGYPGVRTGIVKAHIWFELRRHYRQLRPLWLAVCAAFPNIPLFPPESPLREALRLRQMRLRYYRRVIECRDGLVCLSPYLAEPVDAGLPHARQAELVRDALTRSSRGEQLAETSVIAAPAAAGMEADTRELLALARAFERLTGRDPAIGNGGAGRTSTRR